MKMQAKCWLVGCFFLAPNRQRGLIDTAPLFTVPCEGRKARFLHRSQQESNHCATPAGGPIS